MDTTTYTLLEGATRLEDGLTREQAATRVRDLRKAFADRYGPGVPVVHFYQPTHTLPLAR